MLLVHCRCLPLDWQHGLTLAILCIQITHPRPACLPWLLRPLPIQVEIKTRPDTPDIGSLQRAADFVHAFILGFEIADGIALLRLDDLYVECFEVKDVKTLRGEHLARCIGRLAGKSGKTKFTIENASRTRIVIADTKIHILGSFQNIRVARDAICALIMGSPAGKVYSRLRSVTARLNESY